MDTLGQQVAALEQRNAALADAIRGGLATREDVGKVAVVAAATLAETQKTGDKATEAIGRWEDLAGDRGEKWAQVLAGIQGNEKLRARPELLELVMLKWQGKSHVEIAREKGWKSHASVSNRLEEAGRLCPALRAFDWWRKERGPGGGRRPG